MFGGVVNGGFVGGTATPVPTSGLAAWWRGDVGLTLDGSNNVTAWADQSGNDHTLAPGTAPNITTINGLTAVEFDGSNSEHLIVDPGPGAVFGGQDPDFSLFLVAAVDSLAGASAYVVTAGDADNGSNFHEIVFSTTSDIWLVNRRADGDGVASQFTIGDAAAATQIVQVIADGTSYTGKVTDDTEETATVDAGDNTGLDRFTVGAFRRNGGPTFYFTGSVAEILIYNRAVSAAERTEITDWLTRWGIDP